MKNRSNTIFDSWKNWAIKYVFGDPRPETAGHIHLSTARSELSNKLGGNTYETWVAEAFMKNEVICGSLKLITDTFNESNPVVIDKDGNHLDQSTSQQLIDFINEDSTTRQFFTQLVYYMYLGGAAFIEKARDRGGRLTALYLIRPDRMKIHATPEEGITHYTFQLGSVRKRLDKEDIIFIPFISPTSPYEAYSPLWSLTSILNADNAAKTHSEELLDNRGRPGSLITTENEMDPEEAYSMATSWDRQFRGAKNGSTGILWNGAKYEQLGMSMQELEFTELRKLDEAKILSTLGIPLQLYGSITSNDSSTYNNVREAKKRFWEQTIIPLQSIILDALNDDEELIEDAELIFDRSQVQALQEDLDAAAIRAGKLYQENAVITLNEAREMIGLEPIENGDELYTPPSQFDFGFEEEKGASSEEMLKKQQEVQESFLRKELTEDLHNQLAIALGRESLSKSFYQRTIRMINKHLKQQVQDLVNRVGTKESKNLKDFESRRLEEEIRNLIPIWSTNLQADTIDVLGDLLRKSAEASASQVGVSNINLDRREVIEFIQSYSYKFANKVSNTSAQAMRNTIAQGVTQGKTLGDLSKDISKLSTDWSKSRSKMIARTEVSRAANTGARLGYQKSGVVKKLMFSAILDGATSEICQSLNGKIVGIQENFLESDEGFTMQDGTRMNLDYTDGEVREPPCHPNCRSTIIPIIE